MKDADFKKAFVDSMHEMHEAGDEWLFMLDIAKEIPSHDESYMRRYRKVSRLLGYVGIHRPEKPTRMTSSAKLYPTARVLERDGVIESTWQNPENELGERGRRVYRIIPEPTVISSGAIGTFEALTPQEMNERFPEHGGSLSLILALHPDITLALTEEQASAVRALNDDSQNS